MLARINPKPLSGTVPAIASKSMAHRIIIAAALIALVAFIIYTVTR